MAPNSCSFCKIVLREAPADLVFETSDFLAFVPLSPATAGHTLVIPRDHVPDVWSLSPSLVGPLFETVVTVGAAIRDALDPDGMNIIHSAGRAATQTVFHLHVHLLPRWSADAVENFWPDPEEGPPQWAQDKALDAIRSQLS